MSPRPSKVTNCPDLQTNHLLLCLPVSPAIPRILGLYTASHCPTFSKGINEQRILLVGQVFEIKFRRGVVTSQSRHFDPGRLTTFILPHQIEAKADQDDDQQCKGNETSANSKAWQ